MWRLASALGVIVALTCGCGADDAETGVNYQSDIRTLLEANCVSCHVEGGVAPFALDDWESVERYEDLIVNAVSTGAMPPWPVDESCRDIDDSRALSDEELALFEQWKQAGFLEGDEKDYEAPAEIVGPDLGEPTLLIGSGDSYVADVQLTDDYHCFLMDHVFEQDAYVTAMDILPDRDELVHHVQIHSIPAEGIAIAEANDEAYDGHGYSCFGGVNVTGSENMFSWRPGTQAIQFPDGDAAFVPAGSGVVIQVHYNMQWLQEGETPQPDSTQIGLWLLPEGELPQRVIRRSGEAVPGLFIRPGDEEATFTRMMSMKDVGMVGSTYVPGEVIGMTPHMHNLGTRLSLDMKKGDETTCLVNVPEWDFEWQMDYFYKEEAYLEIDPAANIELTCVYDNTPGNQVLINGERQVPRLVTWGDGSLDEMCLNYVWVRHERDAFLEARR